MTDHHSHQRAATDHGHDGHAHHGHTHHGHAHHDHGHGDHGHEGHDHEERVALEDQIRRLQSGAYGEIADAQNALIWSKVGNAAESVLEIGCGCARLVGTDPVSSRLTVGLDIDEASLAAARGAWQRPNLRLVRGSAFTLPFKDRAFEAVVLRESIHHLKSHGSHDVIVREAARVCARKLIVFDPNMNAVQKLSRWLIRFKDDETHVADILKELRVVGFRPRSVQFRDVFAFPLSGGLIAHEFFRRESPIWKTVVRLDSAVTKLLDHTPRLKRFICWRYLLVAERVA